VIGHEVQMLVYLLSVEVDATDVTVKHKGAVGLVVELGIEFLADTAFHLKHGGELLAGEEFYL
jgi:hypothetical protein